MPVRLSREEVERLVAAVAERGVAVRFSLPLHRLLPHEHELIKRGAAAAPKACDKSLAPAQPQSDPAA